MTKIYEALQQAGYERQPELDIGPVPPFIEGALKGPELVTLSRPDSYLSECFRFLRSELTRPFCGSPPRTILITSALKGEGKTFIASNLAVSISQSLEEHVLLIDADLRNPCVHRRFSITGIRRGLADYLAGGVALSSVLRRTDIGKVTILPAGCSSAKPAELLTSTKMRMLIHETRDRYPDRYVIIDSPPLELTPESSVLARDVDAVIMVVLHGQTPRHDIQLALKRIPKEKLFGIVYNRYEEPLKSRKKYRYYRYGDNAEKP